MADAGAEEKLLIRWCKKTREQRVRETSRLDTRMFYNFPTDHVSF